MNWTSTQIPLWQIDCDSFCKVGRVFELRNVSSFEHHQFIEAFAAKHGLTATISGTTVVFEPKSPAPKSPANSTPDELESTDAQPLLPFSTVTVA
jgi:hypothetical protein